MYGEDYRAAPPAVLGCTDEALGDSDLVGYLPGVAGCLARAGCLGRGWPWWQSGRQPSFALWPDTCAEVVDGYAQAALGGCLPLAGLGLGLGLGL